MTIKIDGAGPHPFPVIEKIDVDEDYGRGHVVKLWTRVEGQLVSVDVFLNIPQSEILESSLGAYREQRRHQSRPGI
jgi:hypothetical protein